MSLNDTPSGERVHIGFFGMRNAGKSSLVNAVTGQDLAVVSPVKGTTTDPVRKAMELLPLGPVVIIDTPGLDDEGQLGELRVKKTRETLGHTDIAVLVTDASTGLRKEEEQTIALFQERKLPYIVVCNKADLLFDTKENEKPGWSTGFPKELKAERLKEALSVPEEDILYVSALTGQNVHQLKEKLASFAKKPEAERKLVSDLLSPGDLAVLVIPLDGSAPKGRLILPQQQTIRDILDVHCTFAACQETELADTLAALKKKPKLVITDSQAFERVAKTVPQDIWMTSFSILFARYKGNLTELVRGADRLAVLKDGDKVLISEGCTHHRQCNDIGTVKLPGWIEKYCQARPDFSFSSGSGFPEDLQAYQLIIHCGGCMLNEKEMKSRMAAASKAGVPMVNYGIAIARMNGILDRSLEPFPEFQGAACRAKVSGQNVR